MKTGQYDVAIESTGHANGMMLTVTMRDCGCSATKEVGKFLALSAAVNRIEYLADQIASSHDCARP